MDRVPWRSPCFVAGLLDGARGRGPPASSFGVAWPSTSLPLLPPGATRPAWRTSGGQQSRPHPAHRAVSYESPGDPAGIVAVGVRLGDSAVLGRDAVLHPPPLRDLPVARDCFWLGGMATGSS